MEVLKVTFVEIHVPSAQSLSRYKKMHNDFTKSREMCKKGILCERMDNYKGHYLSLFVPCNKSFSKILFLFVLSICLPPRFALVSFFFDPGK